MVRIHMEDAPYRALGLTLAAVAARTGISRGRLLLPGRGSKIESRARMVAMYVLRTTFGMSYPVVGQLVGGRNHSTVFHAVECVNRDPLLKAYADAVANDLRSGS